MLEHSLSLILSLFFEGQLQLFVEWLKKKKKAYFCRELQNKSVLSKVSINTL